jgi:hypothetical protein
MSETIPPAPDIAAGDRPELIDVAPASAGGQPSVALWAGNAEEPVIVPVGAIPALIEALACAMVDALT